MSKVSRGDLGLLLGALALFVSLGGVSVAADVGAQASALLTGKKLKSGTITAREIKTGGVGSAEIADGAVKVNDLGRISVTRGKIAPDAVGAEQVADDAIGPDEITDGLSNTIAVGEGEVGSGQIADGSVRDTDLSAGSVGTVQLGDGSVRFVDMGADSVGGEQVRNGSIGFGDLTDGTSNTILFGEVEGGRLRDDSVTSEHIDEGTLPFIEDDAIKLDGDLQTSEVATPAAYGAIASKQVSTFQPGKALLTAAFSAKDAPAPGEGRVRYRLTRNGADVGTGAVQELNLHAVPEDAQSGAATAVVPIPAGSHTFALEAVDVGSGSVLLRRSISVLVIPD